MINPVPKPKKKKKEKKLVLRRITLQSVIDWQHNKRKWTKSAEKKAIKRLSDAIKEICSEICRLLWKGKCAVCGQPGTAAHHFFGWKACSNVRFDLDNLVWLCYYDHIGKIHQQGLTEQAREALIERIGEERFLRLYQAAFQPADYTIEKLIAIQTARAYYLKTLKENLAKGYGLK